MSVELRPLGVACNLGCTYCYQQPQRDAGNQRTPYDLERIKAEAARLGGPFTLFGGEPLLMRFEDLEHLFAWGMATFGSSTIQTNGVLIEDRHIELFRRYKVGVGISIDGPGELNDVRWNGGLAKTRAATAHIEEVIERLCAARLVPGLIVTLHRGNATAAKLPRMVEWLHRLDALGIGAVRLHLLEIEDDASRSNLALTAAENVAALLTFAEAEKHLAHIRFDLFRDMENLLEGHDGKASCVWRACDPYTTPAVQGVEGNGQSSNCGRTNKEGIDFIKAQASGFERYVALYHTAEADDGCSGCRFFLMCKGQCPGTAIGGDWRNRTENCQEWKRLFHLIETRLVLAGKTPLTLQPLRIELERLQVEAWEQGRNPSIERSLRVLLDGQVRGAPATAARQSTTPRVSWVSEPARAHWKPRLDGLATTLEDLTVHAGRRDRERCAVRRVPEASFERLRALSARHGLGSATLPATALPAAICTRPDAGRSGIFLAGEPATVAAAQAAWAAGDAAAFEARLDLPSCCLRHATAADPTATLEALMRRVAPASTAEIHLAGEIAAHPLLAHLGLTVLPVLPCRLDCGPSLEETESLLRLAADSGHADAVRSMRECLSWALSWSELHGVTEVKTPVFKMCCLADADRGPRRIVRAGESDVHLGGVGLSFPFARPQRGARLVARSALTARRTGQAP